MSRKYENKALPALNCLVALITSAFALTSHAQMMFNNSSPAFISNESATPRVWVTTLNQNSAGAPQLQIQYSDDEGNSWTTYGTLDCVDKGIDVSKGPPSSMFVHSSGAIFLAERVHDTPAKIWKIPSSPSPNLSAQQIVVLDPTATIRQWGWTENKAGELYAAQYGFAGLTHYQTNVSYILKIADSAGNKLPDSSGYDADLYSNWQWPITAYPDTDIAQWIAPRGVVSDRHVHNLRYSTLKETFYINGGDSPRNTSAWNGSLGEAPRLFPRIMSGANTCSSANYLLTGYTGLAFAADGIYTGDDFTSCQGDSTTLNARGNSIRFYPWTSMTNGVPRVNEDPTLNIKRLTNSYDTPIFDLHASNDGLNLFFVNYDEPHCDYSACYSANNPSAPAITLPVRMSAVHRLSRTSTTSPTASGVSPAASAPWTYKVLDCAQSSYLNFVYIASDRFGGIPNGMKSLFVFADTCAVDQDGHQMDRNCTPYQLWRIKADNATPSYCPAN